MRQIYQITPLDALQLFCYVTPAIRSTLNVAHGAPSGGKMKSLIEITKASGKKIEIPKYKLLNRKGHLKIRSESPGDWRFAKHQKGNKPEERRLDPKQRNTRSSEWKRREMRDARKLKRAQLQDPKSPKPRVKRERKPRAPHPNRRAEPKLNGMNGHHLNDNRLVPSVSMDIPEDMIHVKDPDGNSFFMDR